MTRPYDDYTDQESRVTQKQLSPWFVAIMETIGYALCGLVGIGLFYSVMTQVDVRVPFEGSLVASAESAIAPSESVVADWLVQPGQKVGVGDPLCALAVNEASMGEVRARQLLHAAWQDLAALSDSRSQSAALQARAAFEALAIPQGLQTITAPGPGIVAPAGAALRAELLKPGEPVAHIVDESRLVLVGTVTASESAKISVGNLAMARVPSIPEALEGKVVDVSKDAPGQITLHFESIPESLRQMYFADLLSSEGDIPEITACKAEIVLGRISLFRSLFGRR